MIENQFDGMKLPKVNPNEELEDISNNLFIPLFDVTKFEIRKESGRDKGIDFRVELKKNGGYTGFRFLIQLKATEKLEKKVDGSVSIQIDTSNINYLLNSGIPAYYCMYFKKDQVFLCESVNEFAKTLNEVKPDWQKKDSHALRLERKLTADVFSEIYDHTLQRGIFFRKMSEKLTERSSLVSDKVVVDADMNVVTDAEVRKLVELGGLYLINESRSIDVIKLHQKASQGVAASAKYNMVVGIAYYYTGELIESLSFIKAAFRLKSELSNELLEHLSLFDVTLRYALGILSKEEYEAKLETLGNSSHIRYYIKIQRAKETYLRSEDPDVDKRYDEYLLEMNGILKAPDANDNIKLLVRCELVLIDGSKINVDYARSIAQIKAYEHLMGGSIELLKSMWNEIAQKKTAWASRSLDIKKAAQDSGNHFVFFHVVVNESKVDYEFEVYTDMIHLDEQITPVQLSKERMEHLDAILSNLAQAEKYFRAVIHIDNLCAVLSLQYEIFHFRQEFDRADAVFQELSTIVDTYEYKEFKTKLNALRKAGTTHEKLLKFFSDIDQQANDKQLEYDRMVAEMKNMDRIEREQKKKIHDARDVIQLFPIGHFEFPGQSRSDVFEILKISSEVRKNFENMWDEFQVIPIANIYCSPITEEGYGKVAGSNDINAWRNIYRIRKEFFERKYYRIELQM